MKQICPTFNVNLLVFHSLRLEVEARGVPIFATEWKRFFVVHGWEGACSLFNRLGSEEIQELFSRFVEDSPVSQVFADEGERHLR